MKFVSHQGTFFFDIIKEKQKMKLYKYEDISQPPQKKNKFS